MSNAARTILAAIIRNGIVPAAIKAQGYGVVAKCRCEHDANLLVSELQVHSHYFAKAIGSRVAITLQADAPS